MVALTQGLGRAEIDVLRRAADLLREAKQSRSGFEVVAIHSDRLSIQISKGAKTQPVVRR